MHSPLGSGLPALEALAVLVLDHVQANGESAVRDIPTRWPVTRQQVRLIVRLLAHDGLLQLRTAGLGELYARLRDVASAA